MIRYYESIGLAPPAGREASGYRTFRADDIHTFRFIGRARPLGFPIATILDGLAKPGKNRCDDWAIAATRIEPATAAITGVARRQQAVACSTRWVGGWSQPCNGSTPCEQAAM